MECVLQLTLNAGHIPNKPETAQVATQVLNSNPANALTLQHLTQTQTHYVVLGVAMTVFDVQPEAISVLVVSVSLWMPIAEIIRLPMVIVLPAMTGIKLVPVSVWSKMLDLARKNLKIILCVVSGRIGSVRLVQIDHILMTEASVLKLIHIVRNFHRKREFVRNVILDIS